MQNYLAQIKKSWFFYLPAGIWLIHLFIIFVFLPASPIKDERTFYAVAVSFKNISSSGFFELLKTYDAPQTPLVFIISGLLLKIGSSIIILRVFDSAMVFISFVIFCKSIEQIGIVSTITKLFFACIFLLNPYFHFIAVTFYTDSLYLLLISISIFLIINNKKNVILFVSFFLLMLTRQFGVFLPAGFIFDSLKFKSPFINKYSIYTLLTFSGILMMFILWKGLMPYNIYGEMMLTIREKYGYLFPYVPAYNFSAIGFYLSPLFLFFIRRVYNNRIFYFGGMMTSAFYILFPAKQNFTNLLFENYVTTLGFFHKVMFQIFGNPLFNIPLILFSFLAGGWILIIIFSNKVPNIFKIFIALYVLMSFFNLQAWDKYLIDIEFIIVLSLIYFLKDYLNTIKIKKPPILGG